MTDTMTPEQARALLQADERVRQEAFVAAYNELVKQYGYGFSAVPQIDSDGRIVAGLQLTKIKEQNNGIK
jgi:hypothetical protein